jgi:hypothetical protein
VKSLAQQRFFWARWKRIGEVKLDFRLNKGDFSFLTVSKKFQKTLAWNFTVDILVCPSRSEGVGLKAN